MRSLIAFVGFVLVMMVSCGGEKNKSQTNPVPTMENTGQSKIEKAKKTEDQDETTMSKKQLAQAQKLIDEHKDLASIDAKKVFKSSCAICHGFKGNMMINGAKDLTKSKISLKESVAQVYFGKGLMTPFKGVLKDEEIVAVSQYVETLRK